MIPNSKFENLRSKGTWRRNGPEIVTGLYPDPYKVVGAIYYNASTNNEEMSYEEAEANAEFICKAVNEYNNLVAVNQKLLKSLKENIITLKYSNTIQLPHKGARMIFGSQLESNKELLKEIEQ